MAGSNDPVDVDVARWAERHLGFRGVNYFGTEIRDRIVKSVGTAKSRDGQRVEAIAPNRDLFPRDEFSTPT